MPVMPEIPAQLLESFKLLDADVAQRLTDALTPVAGELGPREEAVLERLVRGIADGAPGGGAERVRATPAGDGQPRGAAGDRAGHRGLSVRALPTHPGRRS